ncbi:MAG: hypothetical protein ABEI74_02275 [Candidatus Pacearchaeota archaeon]
MAEKSETENKAEEAQTQEDSQEVQASKSQEEVQESTDEKEAEAESQATEDNSNEEVSDEKRKQLMEKAKKLKEQLEEQEPETEELKEKVKVKKKKEMLVELEDYVKSGIYIGTRVVTPDMKPYVYRRRADGLAIFNTNLIDEKLRESVDYLAQFNPEDIILVCKRKAGWKVAQKFGELTGIKTFTKKYPAGILTNTELPDFFENKLTIITDAWLDKNALKDTLRVKKDVLMVCDTNNFAKGASKFLIGNNKSPKSLGLIFYLLARGYLEKKGEDTSQVPELDWWTGHMAEAQMGASKGV